MKTNIEKNIENNKLKKEELNNHKDNTREQLKKGIEQLRKILIRETR